MWEEHCWHVHLSQLTVGDLVKQNDPHTVFYFENWPDSLLCPWLPVCTTTELASTLLVAAEMVDKLFLASHDLCKMTRFTIRI